MVRTLASGEYAIFISSSLLESSVSHKGCIQSEFSWFILRKSRASNLSMRFLILHVTSFRCTITEKGRSKVYEPYDDPVTQVAEALIVLSSIERGDERAPERVAARASEEIVKLASQLKVTTIVLHPFAHFF